MLHPSLFVSLQQHIQKKKISQLRSAARELIPFTALGAGEGLTLIKLAYDLRRLNGRLRLQRAPSTDYRPVCQQSWSQAYCYAHGRRNISGRPGGCRTNNLTINNFFTGMFTFCQLRELEIAYTCHQFTPQFRYFSVV